MLLSIIPSCFGGNGGKISLKSTSSGSVSAATGVTGLVAVGRNVGWLYDARHVRWNMWEHEKDIKGIGVESIDD